MRFIDIKGLLRAVVATAGNDHRLGANEAPPAIISIFLGDQLTHVFEQIKAGGANSSLESGIIDRRCRRASTACQGRRRPKPNQPVCFHRQSIRIPCGRIRTVDLRSAGRDEYDHRRIGRLLCDEAGRSDCRVRRTISTRAIQSLLTEIINECSPIIFDGDGYSEEWHKEAEKRGLLNLKTTADALPELVKPSVVALFEHYGVLSERELHSRFETYVEQYCLKVDVEANLTISMAKTLIFPAAIRYPE